MIEYTVDYVEFPSGSADGSSQFFAQVFGWSATSYGPDYADVQGGSVTFGFQAADGEKTSAPLVTIRTNDLEQARKAIESAGGVITVEPFDFPGGRRFHFREPGGSELALWRPTDAPH